MVFENFSEEKEVGHNKTDAYENTCIERNLRRERRPKKRRLNAITNGMGNAYMCEDITSDHAEWRFRGTVTFGTIGNKGEGEEKDSHVFGVL